MTYSLEEILQRIGQIIGSYKQADIAKALNVSGQALTSWKKRESIPWDKLAKFSIGKNISLPWLLTGQEQKCLLSESKYKIIDRFNEHLNFAIKKNLKEKDFVLLIMHEIEIYKVKNSLQTNNFFERAYK